MAFVHRGVKDTDVLNHLVMHASRVRNIMLARATLMNTAQPMDIVALDRGKGNGKGKGLKGDKGKG